MEKKSITPPKNALFRGQRTDDVWCTQVHDATVFHSDRSCVQLAIYMQECLLPQCRLLPRIIEGNRRVKSLLYLGRDSGSDLSALPLHPPFGLDLPRTESPKLLSFSQGTEMLGSC